MPQSAKNITAKAFFADLEIRDAVKDGWWEIPCELVREKERLSQAVR